ncbi:MAG TPA: YtxH domain-containing protein [Candidatus Saccharimonadales bacterium]
MANRTGAKWGILGVIAGAIAGLLFAPKSGKETREDIKEGAVKTKREAGKKYNQAKVEVSKQTRRAKSTAKRYANKTKRAAKRAAADVKDEFGQT